MSKVFSPLTLGVGLTALVTLVPGLGIGSKVGKDPAGTTKAVSEAKRAPRAEAVEGLLDQCLAERPKGGASVLRVTILTLPDPQRTHMALWFDLRLNAVQRAFKEYDFLPRAFFLPWDAKSREDTGPGVSSGYPDPSPGLIWFARERQASDPPGGPAAYHALFIVGESQSLGLNREAMRQALRLADKVRGPGEGPPITIIGPQFSGSLASLGAALADHFQGPAAPPIRIQGTTTLGGSAAETLRATAGGVPASRLSISGWICNLSGPSKDQLLSWYRKEAGWPTEASKVAVFTESNTAYSPGSNPGSNSGGPVTQILFPMGLSRLRAERRAMEHNLAKGGGAKELVLPSTLLGLSEDDARRVVDTVPQYSADTLRNTELTLAGTILSLARRGYTHIGISASDPQDLIFLAERIRAYHPSCTLFTTSGNHVLFAHPNLSAAMDGMVLVGGYPLTDAMRVVSLLKGELESPVRFTSEGEYAAYYATLLALDLPRAKDPARRFWGKQGFISIVKGGSIWPLRHGGLEVAAAPGAPGWDHQVEALYVEGAKQSSDMAEYVLSRLRQLSLLLLLLGGASCWMFLKPILEVGTAHPPEPSLRPYGGLAAGALLAMATVSLLGVGYLLPLSVLKGSPWGDTFLWISLVAWAGLIFITGRALGGRWGWGVTLPLLALALLPAFAVGVWGRTHFLVFIPGYLRFTSPGRGVSLIPTMVLLTASLALLLRTWFDVRRQEHPAFWPSPFGLSAAHGQHLRHFRGLRAKWWIYLLVGILLAFQWALPGGLLRPLMEVPGVTAIVVGVGGCVFVSSLFLFWQLQRGWQELKRILEELDFASYRAAFAEAGKLMHWNAMRALGRGLKTHRSSLRGRQILEDQRGWITEIEPKYGSCLSSLEREEATVPRGRKATSEFARWLFRFKVAGWMSACGDDLKAACDRQPAEAAFHQEAVDLFSALRAITFIRQAFLVARYLLIGSLGSMLLLVLAVAAFDFQPKAEVLTVLGAVLLVMAGWVAFRIVQLEQDPLLCLMEGTVAGEVQLSLGLVENGLRFVLVPLLLLLATLNPSFGGLVLQVFNPLMHLMK
ncbi:MAG: hypothetical protein Q8K67_09390 [Geothrix sp.]|nr:hypothetical protein [Geothrix sp.]